MAVPRYGYLRALVILLPFVYFYFFVRLAHLDAGGLGADIGTSLARMVVAYLIAAALGWLFAVLFYRGRRGDIALPIFDVLQSFPAFAALPLAILALGATKVGTLCN